MQSESKICQNCKKEFAIKPEDFSFYKKLKVPPPTWCPECRAMRRISWRNEKTMHRRACDATGKQIFSFINPKSPQKTYERSYWWSDEWDPLDYGKDVDFTRPFLEQVRELIREVPWFSRSVLNNTNSEYCMNCSDMKNCYLVFHAGNSESCQHGVGIDFSKDSFDNSFINKCELCHECIFCAQCYQTFYCVDCENSQNLYFCKDCVNCQDCIGCAGLRNKQYHIFNKPHTKEEYEEKKRELNLDSRSNLEDVREKSRKIWLSMPVKHINGSHNSAVSGDYIYNSKNVYKTYIARNCEDCKYLQNVHLNPGARDSMDYSFFGKGAELVYESTSCGIDVSDIRFSAFVYPSSQRISYSVMAHSCEDCFGCVGLRSKHYCILNKQYTKEEYEELVPKIIEHMKNMPYEDSQERTYAYGEFFPPEFSPFGYNETVAQEYFPKTKQESEKEGWPWLDAEMKTHEPTLSWKDMPDTAEEAPDDITKEIILCELWDKEGPEKALEHNCSKAFRITPEELQFYKRFHLPLPRRCFNSRHHTRGKLRNSLKLWKRACMCSGKGDETGTYRNTSSHSHHGEEKCPNEFETSYSPEGKEIVYCEECYNQEIA